MQSRRNEDRTILPDPKMKLRDRGIELSHARDPYDMPRRDLSLSPRKVEVSRRLVDGRNNSLERRDFGGAGRGERVRSRSPPFGLMRERRGYDDGVYPSRDFPNAELRQRYEFVDRVDLDADVNAGLKHERRHEAQLIREEDFGGSRFAGQKFMGSEEMFRLPQDLVTTSKYGEGGEGFSSSLANTGQFKDERARYRDTLVDKVSVMESYREREKPIFYSRDVTYPNVPMSQSKDYMRSASGISRAYFEGSYQDDMPLVTDSGKSAKFTEPFGFNVQRSSLESGRDPNRENMDFPHYWRDKFSPTRADRQDYLNPRPREGDSDIYGHSSNNLYRRMGTRERVESVDYDHKDLLRPVMRDPVQDAVDNSEYTSRNLKDRSFVDHPSIQKQKVPNYFDVSASKGEEYFDHRSAHVEYGRVSREREMPHLGVSKHHKISHLRSDFGFGRDAGPTSHGERMRNSPEFEYDRSYEIQAEEHEIYDSSDRALRRKYNPDAEMSRHNPRGIILDKWYSNSRVRHLDDRSEEWRGQDSSIKFKSRSGGYDNKRYPREEREFIGEDRRRFSESEDWLPSDDYMEHVQEHSSKPHKSGVKYSKGHPRHGQQSSHISSRLDRRHVLPKPRNVWIRGQDDNQVDKHDNQVDKHENEVDQSDNWMSSSKPEPREGSEEFKLLVQKAFLIFSKKLNENPAVRKRYKEQGRAGSLFCIVCGRSVSKEFMDTQRLATHAFMSHKFRLRAEHLGLHKAICVLLGWKSEVAPDVSTWVPDPIPYKEAMAQKEDIILWPPVVIIHNSSMEENIVDEQKVVSLEAVGDFLRGKGFSGGKFRMCLGKPGNHGVIVVRFLGTFFGLQDAERLHKYFVDNKRGRDFGRGGPSSSKGKSSSSNEVAGKKNVELVLYGYMGISEDLDKVDIDTKRKCWIKSKKEIHDLENAPVKPN
ncbi:hypothetical protein RHSIM_Rhsim03G0104900 [Rhododendron simsii]|uniref:XS domain-containing protein n=1 Tax=Rhododendron simsii TaxID=118357 RepID=A0A834HA61_RHOSS|nr:hypothetical protein RHSIM_Rhsim03G0104900 [Rhododendron simsii]